MFSIAQYVRLVIVLCILYMVLFQLFFPWNTVSVDAPLDDFASSMKTTLRKDSSDATVMAMATGYNLRDNQQFVGSLRKSGFTGHIMLLVSPDIDESVEKYLVEQKVTIKRLQHIQCNYTTAENKENARIHEKERLTCVHPYPDLKIRWSRFPLLRDLLRDCTECTGPVLVTDFRDTFFQGDPFGAGTHQVTGLEVFQEHKTVTTKHWLVEFPVRDCKGIMLDEPMLCSGTTIGTREDMLKYLSIMQDEMMEWMQDPKCCCFKMSGDDQSIHNYLFYTGKFPFATAIPNRMGTVNTVGVQGSMIFNAHKKTWMDQNFTEGQALRKPFEGADKDTQGGKRWIGLHFDLTDEEVRT
jgi:hypothetical protein